jgi:hypothetical protein
MRVRTSRRRSKTQVAQPRMILRPRAERPMELAPGRLDGQFANVRFSATNSLRAMTGVG